jgi:hypothetical protein
VRPIDDLLDDLGRPALLAVDGRSGSGKTTVARRLVPAGCPLVVVEGVGIGRRDLAAFFDALVWVQTDRVLATARGLARDGDGPAEVAFWNEWEAAERPFLAAERPWDRADVAVAGAPELPHDPATELVVADRS